MIKAKYTVEGNYPIAKDTYSMRLLGDTSGIRRPGQFVNIELEGLFLRRPISICEWDDKSLRLIYKVVGKGTAQMSGMKEGETLDLLCPLGNGFDVSHIEGGKVAVIGGGVGVPPLLGLVKELKKRQGITLHAVLGFGSRDLAFLTEAFEGLCDSTAVATDDGTLGQKGFVTDILKQMEYDYYFTCGPHNMLRAVHALGRPGQLSFEERMGCGFGACMGCSCKTLTGFKRICLDGPVMRSEEVTFDEQA